MVEISDYEIYLRILVICWVKFVNLFYIIYKYIYLLFGGIDRNLILNLVCCVFLLLMKCSLRVFLVEWYIGSFDEL